MSLNLLAENDELRHRVADLEKDNAECYRLLHDTNVALLAARRMLVSMVRSARRRVDHIKTLGFSKN